MKHPTACLVFRPLWAGITALLVAGSAAAQSKTPESRTPEGAAETVLLPEFRVNTDAENAYLATESISGTRTAAKLIELPLSVQWIPSELINDFMLFDFDEMNAFVSNVKPADAAGAGNGGTTLRGFGISQFRNGFSLTQQPDSNNVDRVEIVKGPSSSVYGATGPGGIVNFITKKPQAQPAYSLDVIAGDNDYWRVNGSATGPLSRRLFYRVDATYYDFKRPTDFWFNRTLDLSGGVVFKFTPHTSLQAEFQFTQRVANPFPSFARYIDRNNRTQGLLYTIPADLYPGLGDRLSRFNQLGPYNRYERYNNSSYLTFQHRFTPTVSFQVSLSHSNRHFRRFGPTSTGNWSLITNTWTGNRAAFHQRINYEQDGVQTDLAVKRTVGAAEHQAHIGLDWKYSGQKSRQWQLSNGPAILAGLASGSSLAAWQRPNPFDLDSLLRAGQPVFNDSWPLVAASVTNEYVEDFGAFYNHMATFNERRAAVMGTIRGDLYRSQIQQPLSPRATLRDGEARKRYSTYTVGFTYKIVGEKLVGYGSYGHSFNPSPTVDSNTGETYGNRESTGGEAGFKGLLFNSAFSYTASVFNVRQENETVANPNNPTGLDPTLPALSPGGSTRSKGVGIDVSGRPTKNISLVANMGWLDCRTVQNLADPASVGRRVTNSGPVRKGSIAATYAFPQRRLKGLRSGFTYYYSTENIRFYRTATTTDVYLPGNNYWGGMLSYSWKLSSRVTANLHLAVTDVFSQQVLTDNAFAPTGAQWKLRTGLRF